MVPGTQIEMIGVGEDDFRAELFESFLGEALDGCLSPHGQEKRGLDDAVGRGQAATTRASRIGLRNLKGKIHLRLNTQEQDRQKRLSYFSVSGEDEGPAYAAHHISRPNAEGNGERFRALQFFRV